MQGPDRKMAPEKPPTGWGNDEITQFLEHARNNSFATFANLKGEYQTLAEVSACFYELSRNLDDHEEVFVGWFVLQSLSAYLAGISCALSGQGPESCALLRLALEHSLYGFHFAGNDAALEVWLRRHDSADAKAKVKKLQIKRMIDAIGERLPREAQIIRDAYDSLIDSGAHPNEKALSRRLALQSDDKSFRFDLSFMVGNSLAIEGMLRLASRIGVCVLTIFELVYDKRLEILGISSRIVALKQKL